MKELGLLMEKLWIMSYLSLSLSVRCQKIVGVPSLSLSLLDICV